MEVDRTKLIDVNIDHLDQELNFDGFFGGLLFAQRDFGVFLC